MKRFFVSVVFGQWDQKADTGKDKTDLKKMVNTESHAQNDVQYNMNTFNIYFDIFIFGFLCFTSFIVGLFDFFIIIISSSICFIYYYYF